MLKRLYVHNFRCLENFDLAFGAEPSTLLIGRNGSGKTTISLALEVLKKIARGTNRVRHLIGPQDATHGRSQVPMRFAVDAVLGGKHTVIRSLSSSPTAFVSCGSLMKP